MVSPRQEIQMMPQRIISLLNNHKKIERKVLVSHLRLKTGFSTKTINDLVSDLIIISVINDKKGFLNLNPEVISLDDEKEK